MTQAIAQSIAQSEDAIRALLESNGFALIEDPEALWNALSSMQLDKIEPRIARLFYTSLLPGTVAQARTCSAEELATWLGEECFLLPEVAKAVAAVLHNLCSTEGLATWAQKQRSDLEAYMAQPQEFCAEYDAEWFGNRGWHMDCGGFCEGEWEVADPAQFQRALAPLQEKLPYMTCEDIDTFLNEQLAEVMQDEVTDLYYKLGEAPSNIDFDAELDLDRIMRQFGKAYGLHILDANNYVSHGSFER